MLILCAGERHTTNGVARLITMTTTPQPIGCPENGGTIEVTYVKISSLHPHPLNKKLYGDEPDETFADDLHENGLLEPLIVTTSSLIISGHRRWHAAQRLGLTTVPARIISEEDPDHLERLLLAANTQRKKTREQQIREFEHYLSLESKTAKNRQGRRSDIGEKFPESERGWARKSAAEKVGLSDRSAERGLQVLNALSQLDAKENAQFLEEVRTILNEHGIDPAYKRAVALGLIHPPSKRKAATPTSGKNDNSIPPSEPETPPISENSNLPAQVTPESRSGTEQPVTKDIDPNAPAPPASTIDVPETPVQQESTAILSPVEEQFELADGSKTVVPASDVVSMPELRAGYKGLLRYAKTDHHGFAAVSAARLTTIQGLYLELARTMNLQFPHGIEEDERSLALGAVQALAHTMENPPRK